MKKWNGLPKQTRYAIIAIAVIVCLVLLVSGLEWMGE